VTTGPDSPPLNDTRMAAGVRWLGHNMARAMRPHILPKIFFKKQKDPILSGRDLF